MPGETLAPEAPAPLNLHGLPSRRLRVSDLSALREDLWTIRQEMRRANDTYGDASQDIPFKELSKQLKQFATKWDDTRAKIQRSVEELHSTVKAVDDAFGEIDRKMGLALRDPRAFDHEMYQTLLESGDHTAATRHRQEMDAREAQRQAAAGDGGE